MKKILLLGYLLFVNQLSIASEQEPNNLSSILAPSIAQCNIGNIRVINTVGSDIFYGDENAYKEIAEEFIESEEINVNDHSTILLQEYESSFAFSLPARSSAKVCVFDINDHEIALIHITKNDYATTDVE